MGCTQSKQQQQRSDEVSHDTSRAPASPVKVRATTVEDAPVASPPKTVQEEASSADAAPAPKPMEEETAVTMEPTLDAEPTPTKVEAEVIPTPAPQAAEKSAEDAPAAPAVPALALRPANTNQVKSRTRSRTPKKQTSVFVTPRAKENMTTSKAKTPTRNQTPSRRGLGVAAVNTQQASRSKQVKFDAVPPPTSTAATRKTKVRKIAGRHAGSVNEDVFLASVAAFERQLTHRGTLEAHLNSR